MSRATAPVAAIVLAAGASRRMGRPKQLLPYRGRPLVQHAVDAAEGAGVDEILVVVGHEADAIERAVRLPSHGRFVRNAEHASGQGSSLRAGLRAAGPETAAAVVLLSDQPGVGAEAVRLAIESWREAATPAVRALYGTLASTVPAPPGTEGGPDRAVTGAGGGGAPETPGHPVVIGRELWDRLLDPASGGSRPAGPDEGARGLLDRHPEWVTLLYLAVPPPLEVDTPDDYRRLLGTE